MRRPDGVAREQTSKVNHVEAVVQVSAVCLEAHMDVAFLVEVYTGEGLGRRTWVSLGCGQS